MILTDIITMLTLLRELAARKGELDQNYFHNFILPMWLSFTEIHNNYKESFSRYSDMVKDENISAESILEKIRTDSISTDDLRTNIMEMMRHLAPNVLSVRENMVHQFLISIRKYFLARLDVQVYEMKYATKGGKEEEEKDIAVEFYPYKLGEISNRISNMPRYMAIIHLSRQGSSIDRVRAKEVFEEILRSLQDRYGVVTSNYYAIKKSLLT